MCRWRNQTGFTLLELLVVIAIIGIIAAVVLASLSGARREAQNKRIIVTLNDIRTQAELFALSNDGLYSPPFEDNKIERCAGADPASRGGMFDPSQKDSVADNIRSLSDLVPNRKAEVLCVVRNNTWAVAAPLHGGGWAGWCVDNHGAAKEVYVFKNKSIDPLVVENAEGEKIARCP